MNNKRLLDIVGDIDDRYVSEAEPAVKKNRSKPIWVKCAVIAACIVLLVSACFGAFAIAAEAKEYRAAVRFFNEYNLSTEGLTRSEIKAVYRDITTKSFSYSKTGAVIRKSISSENIGGYEISQDNPTPEDIENLWNYKNFDGKFFSDSEQDGVHYIERNEYKEDATLGFNVHDKSYIEKYDGDTLIWSFSTPDFVIRDYSIVSDGVIAYGYTYTWSSSQTSNEWMVKIDADGNLVWKQTLSNRFENEDIAEVLENADGSYAVFSCGNFEYFCLRQYTANGKETHFRKTEVGNYGIRNAIQFENGYLVQLIGHMPNEQAAIFKVDYEGNITDSFSYSDEDSYYYITDMIEFNGKIYLSAYAFPRLGNGERNSAGKGELGYVIDYLSDYEMWEISSDELTPMIRDNYTAILFICEPSFGKPQKYYSVIGSLGVKLAVSDNENLIWDVESITTTFYSPVTSSFTIGGTSYVFRYTFDNTGLLVSQEKTGEIVNFRR